MITRENVEKIVEKHNLKSLENPDNPRMSVRQVVHELKDKGLSNVAIGGELGMAESSVRVILLDKKLNG